ncbi:MAG: amidohydrolase family protein [Acidimicrobiales bacterium]
MARTPAEHRDWLAQTVEEPLEPELAIVDPHHHLWTHIDPPYLLDELLADTGAGHHVTDTVFIECGWGWDRAAADPVMIPLPEVVKVTELAEESDRRAVASGSARIARIVGHADLRHGADAGRALDALAEAGGSRFVGIRHAPAWDADPAIPNHRTDPAPGLLGSDAFRAGFAELARRDLTYDAWLYHPQIPELTALARAFPDTTIVCDHLGGPLGVRSYRDRHDEVLAATRGALAELATCPNVSLKLGGIGMTILGGGWHRQDRPPGSEQLAAYWGPFIRWCIETFGPERAMFESNFPVDGESCSYLVLWNAFKRMVPDASASEKAALFSGTARRVYRL